MMLYRRPEEGNPAWEPAYPGSCENEICPQPSRRIPFPLRCFADGNIVPVLEKHRFDAMIIHGIYDSFAKWQAYAWCHRNRIPYFIRTDANITAENTLFRRITRGWIVSSRIRYAAGLLCIGTQNEKYYCFYGAKPEQCFLCPWEIDYDSLELYYQESMLNREKIRQAYGCSSHQCLLVTVGRLVKAKGFETLIPAVGRLRKDGYDVQLLIAGEGPRRSEIVRCSRESGQSAVRLLGNLDRKKLIQLLTAADVFVLASTYEPWGLVVNEAALCGLPLILSDAVGAAADLLIPEWNGFLFPAGDSRIIYKNIEKLIQAPGLRRTMGQRSRERILWWRTACSAIEGYRKALSTICK